MRGRRMEGGNAHRVEFEASCDMMKALCQRAWDESRNEEHDASTRYSEGD
jgi:hypothetical protein